jgi:hypothetical protein
MSFAAEWSLVFGFDVGVFEAEQLCLKSVFSLRKQAQA